jgi:hypothetical protein
LKKLELVTWLALGLMACGDSGSSGGSGGSGASSNGGDNTGGTSTAGAPSDGGAPPIVGGAPSNGGAPPIVGGAPSTGGAPPIGCDGTGVCQDADEDPFNDCVSCALADACSGQLQACGAEPDCCTPQADGSCGADSFVGCINLCDAQDQACFDNCLQTHPTGAQVYNELVFCAICDNCYNDCDGASSGCP